MTEEDKPILEVYGLFAEWYKVEYMEGKGYPNLKDYGKIFTHTFKPFTNKKYGTHTWSIAINGQDKVLQTPSKIDIQPYNLHVYRNGWFVAMLSPHEGTGIYRLDDQFIDLLKHLLKRKRKEVLEAE